MSECNKENFANNNELLSTPVTKVRSSRDNGSSGDDHTNFLLQVVDTPSHHTNTITSNDSNSNNPTKNHNLLSIKKIMTTPMKRMTPLKRMAPTSNKKITLTNNNYLNKYSENKMTTPMKIHSSKHLNTSSSKYPLLSVNSHKKSKTGGKSSKRQKLTPPRSLEVGCSQKKTLLSQQKQQRLQLDNIPRMSLSPHFLNLQQRTSNNYNNDHELRSSEMDPSRLQLELPTLVNIKLNASICSLMENYIEIAGGSDFDFSSLMAVSVAAVAPVLTREEQNELQAKKLAVQTKLTKIQDDLTVQGFYREYIVDKGNPSGLGRVEACVFSTEKLRKIIICFRGSNDNQKKPIQGGGTNNKLYSANKKNHKNGNSCTSSSDKTSPTKKSTKSSSSSTTTTSSDRRRDFENEARMNINEEYVHILSANNLEGNLLTLMKRLTALKPFHDIVITGHAFGACLATISSQRLALQEPTMRIYCQVFGSPKVGGSKFRQLTHTLPNLNFVRMERNTDPFICKPEAAEWAHIGHSIMIQSQNTPLSSGFSAISEVGGATNNSQGGAIQVNAYRFDKHRPENSKNFIKHGLTKLENYTKGKVGNELNSYIKDLEKMDDHNIWVTRFVGEDVGDGICGDDDETRYLV